MLNSTYLILSDMALWNTCFTSINCWCNRSSKKGFLLFRKYLLQILCLVHFYRSECLLFRIQQSILLRSDDFESQAAIIFSVWRLSDSVRCCTCYSIYTWMTSTTFQNTKLYICSVIARLRHIFVFELMISFLFQTNFTNENSNLDHPSCSW